MELGVLAYSQPWFPGWNRQHDVSRVARKMKIADLFDSVSNQWKLPKLNKIFQGEQVAEIVNMVDKPMSNKIFMWRLISGALMLAANMHRRMPRWSPICQRCNLEVENVCGTHRFFFCLGSRAVWFVSNLGLRTQDLSLNIVQPIRQRINGIGEEEIKVFTHMLWEIWKARNATEIQHRKFDPVEVNMKVKYNVQVERQCVGLQGVSTEKHKQQIYQYKGSGWQVISDGSWEVSGRAGCAYLIYHKGTIWKIGYSCHNLQNPFHAEVMALKEAIQQVQIGWEDEGIGDIECYSDCQELVRSVMEGVVSINVSALQATKEVQHILQVVQMNQAEISIKKVNRKVVHQAHQLANLARKNAAEYYGLPRPFIIEDREIHITKSLDDRFFEKVQESPP